jgi:hypothetical protein
MTSRAAGRTGIGPVVGRIYLIFGYPGHPANGTRAGIPEKRCAQASGLTGSANAGQTAPNCLFGTRPSIRTAIEQKQNVAENTNMEKITTFASSAHQRFHPPDMTTDRLSGAYTYTMAPPSAHRKLHPSPISAFL